MEPGQFRDKTGNGFCGLAGSSEPAASYDGRLFLYGEAGIRTPDTGLTPYNGLANRRLQPLGHLTADGKYT